MILARRDTLERAYAPSLRFAAVFASVLGANAFDDVGVPAAFWALLAGMVVWARPGQRRSSALLETGCQVAARSPDRDSR